MFKSVFKDVNAAFNYGNMLTKIIIINVGIYVVTAILAAFLPEIYTTHILPYLALPGDLITFLYRPWTIITHMFLHGGFWHMAMNMLILYWFGNIAGDLLGDRRILPVYIMGGLVGAIFYMLSYPWMSGYGSMALGASAATLAIVFTAVMTAPDYIMNLLLIGPVRIKYIGLTILFFDLIGTAGNINTGGHIAHLGGAAFGFLFVFLLNKGIDLTSWFFLKKLKETKPNIFSKASSPLKVSHKSEQLKRRKPLKENENLGTRVDVILEKIKAKGYESLTEEEKEVLYLASKK